MQENQIRFDMDFAKVIRMYYARLHSKLAQVGMYRGQPPIMCLLNQYDGMSQKEMAQALNLSPATMTVTLKRMEKAGLIVREMDANDQRVLRVHLSELGRQRYKKGEEQCELVSSELLEGFTQEERAQLQSYMQRIAKNMENAVRREGELDEEQLEEPIGG